MFPLPSRVLGRFEWSLKGYAHIQLGRVEGSHKDHASTRFDKVEVALDSHVIARVPFFEDRVEGSHEGYATALLCFGAYIAL